MVLFAPIGPYCDPLAQLLWALHRKRQMTVALAHVVVDRRALRYLETELLAPGQILDELRAELPELLPAEGFVVHRPLLPSGELVDDDLEPEHARVYLETMWNAARAAIAAAGPRRVIFGLVAGRRRTPTAIQAAYYQLLARQDDLLLDVRLSDARVVGTGDFFFPGQKDLLKVGSWTIDPQTIDVELVDLALPRLGGLIDPRALETYESAKAAGQAAIDALQPPALSLDLHKGRCRAGEEELPLSKAELCWYAYLVCARAAGEGWVIVGRDGHDALRKFLLEHQDRAWFAKVRTDPLQRLLGGEEVDDEDLRNLRGKTVQKLKAWCAAERPAWAAYLVPESEGNRRQRLPLASAHIRLP